MTNPHWLSDMEYQKAKTQLRMQMSAVFEPFELYGLQIHIPGAIDEVVRLAEDFGLRVRGKDKPISIELIRKKKRKVKK